MSKCTLCPVSEFAFRQVVYKGVLPCRFLFLGEAPGKTEDMTGSPFCGASGRLLDRIVPDEYLEDSAVANVVRCRPTDGYGMRNRIPSWREQETCSQERLLPWMRKEAKPDALILLGRVAQEVVARRDELLFLPKLCLPHPAYLLRRGSIAEEMDVCRNELISFRKRVLK